MLFIALFQALTAAFALQLLPTAHAQTLSTQDYMGVPVPDSPAAIWDMVKTMAILWVGFMASSMTNNALGWVRRKLQPWIFRVAPWAQTEKHGDEVLERMDRMISLLEDLQNQQGLLKGQQQGVLLQ